MSVKVKKYKLFGNVSFMISAALMIAALVTSIFPPQLAYASSGAVWTTTGSCGNPQDANHYHVGDAVYINGSDFAANTTYSWDIIGQPGNASSDPGITVASGTHLTDSNGAFCFLAYTVQPGDLGEYKFDFGDKFDNYRVEAVATPTNTPVPPTATFTPTPTATFTPTFTPTPTSVSSPTSTPTGTLEPTPTPTNSPLPSPTPFIPVTSGGGSSNVLIPVTGVDMGLLGRTLPGTLFGLSFSFAGLGLVFTGLSRRREG